MVAMRWLKKLYVQVLIGVALGALLGYFSPHLAVQAKPLGDLFIKAIKVVVAPVIFFTVVIGIASIGDMRKVARVGIKALIYFEIGSTAALLLGMAVGNLWPVGRGINASAKTLDSGAVADLVHQAHPTGVWDFVLNIVPNTFMAPFSSGEILPVLFIAILFGSALAKYGDRARPLVDLFETVSTGLFMMVGLIMRLAPIGAFGSIAFTIGKYGLGSLARLGEVVVSVYIVSALFVIIVLGTSTWISGFSIFKLIAYFKDELIIVFASTSAETMIPRSMEKLERLGVDRQVIGLVMPTGFSFNMAGTAIYMTIGALFIAHATNTHLSFGQQVGMFLLMMLTSKGAAGVSGGGFIALAATLPTLGLLPVAGLSLLIGVDRFMAEIRAVTNLFSNIVATLVVGRWVGAVDMERARWELSRRKSGDTDTLFGAIPMTNSLKVMSTLATEVAFKRHLLPTWHPAGSPPEVVWGPTAVLAQKIRGGERADVLVMIDETIDELAREGFLVRSSITPIAQAGFGLGVAKGRPHPDISTPEAFVRTLLEARSIVYSKTGASGQYFAKLIESLGIADKVNARAVVIPSGFTAERLKTGECDLAVQQISELMSVDGVEVVGPFPEPYQKHTNFSVAVFADTEDPALAARFVEHLTTGRAAEAYVQGGLKSRLPVVLKPEDDLGAHTRKLSEVSI